MDMFQATAFLAGIIGATAGIPQIYRLVERKKSNDISLMMYLMVGFAQVIWIAYGIHRFDYAIIIPNLVAFSLAMLTVFLTLRYRNGKATS